MEEEEGEEEEDLMGFEGKNDTYDGHQPGVIMPPGAANPSRSRAPLTPSLSLIVFLAIEQDVTIILNLSRSR